MDLSAELKTSSNPRLSFEIALTRMVRPDSDLTLESLAERVEALESGCSAVAHVLPERTGVILGGESVSAVSVSAPASSYKSYSFDIKRKNIYINAEIVLIFPVFHQHNDGIGFFV